MQKRIGRFIAVLAVVMAIIAALGKDAANQMIVNEVKSSKAYTYLHRAQGGEGQSAAPTVNGQSSAQPRH